MTDEERYQCLDCRKDDYLEERSVGGRVFTATDPNSCPWCGGQRFERVLDPRLTNQEAQLVESAIECYRIEHDHGKDTELRLSDARKKMEEAYERATEDKDEQ